MTSTTDTEVVGWDWLAINLLEIRVHHFLRYIRQCLGLGQAEDGLNIYL